MTGKEVPISKIAFLGLGAMGSCMATHLVAAGHDVAVWNRDLAKAQPLAALGARVAMTPREAAADAHFVFAMVRDDDASRTVWLDADAGALHAMASDAVAIDCSTLSIDWVRDLGEQVGARGCGFLDAPVVGSRPQAEQRQLIFLVGGAGGTVERARPVFAEMAAAVHHTGMTGAGAAAKLAVNALFAIQVAAVAELIEMLRAQGFEAHRIVETIAATPVCSPAAKVAAGSMLADAFVPLFPVALVEKDLGYAAIAGRDRMPLTQAAQAIYADAVRQGHGDEHIAAVVRLYR